MMMVMMMMMMQLPATGCIYKSLLLPQAVRHSLFNNEQFQLFGIVLTQLMNSRSAKGSARNLICAIQTIHLTNK
ncbi:hypothetical protein T4B_4982 [Trichinella pseudospiralis]|uniref:Secreted protein n=1 Tax=Trichinella pseudospiralis TaxID=6337 RepID=A0A0V1IIU4_TRIPS|nr:hypothetical protein T4B_4982 [Trichinella pseudospiralis]